MLGVLVRVEPDVVFARARAYGSKDPLWWSNLAATYATLETPDGGRSGFQR
jgi:hypothetical protein